ncbi:MAG: pseudouridine synthase [Butyricicoccus sp.]
MEERLQKLLAQAGLCSRREAERWIDDGRVTVNGKKASVGDKADPRRDKIFVDGKPIGGAEEKVYLMLYKPRGYVTTMKDEHGRKTVADLVRGCGARVVPVGRLDYNSEGLLLLTNDGDLLNALTHPRHEVEKHYEVRVRGNLENIPKLAEPMEIDGYSIRPATVVTIDRDEISAAAPDHPRGRTARFAKCARSAVWRFAASNVWQWYDAARSAPQERRVARADE